MHMIEMEPMNCAVDDSTYTIIDNWFGRDVAQQLLYEEEDVIWLNCSKPSKSYSKRRSRGLRRLLRRPFFIFGGWRKGSAKRGNALSRTSSII